jgi:hypothetical protein
VATTTDAAGGRCAASVVDQGRGAVTSSRRAGTASRIVGP